VTTQNVNGERMSVSDCTTIIKRFGEGIKSKIYQRIYD